MIIILSTDITTILPHSRQPFNYRALNLTIDNIFVSSWTFDLKKIELYSFFLQVIVHLCQMLITSKHLGIL